MRGLWKGHSRLVSDDDSNNVSQDTINWQRSLWKWAKRRALSIRVFCRNLLHKTQKIQKIITDYKRYVQGGPSDVEEEEVE